MYAPVHRNMMEKPHIYDLCN